MSADNLQIPLRFIPTKCEGLPDVTEVDVFTDRLEIKSAGALHVYHFEDMVQWPRHHWIFSILEKFHLRSRWRPIGERDWFHKPGERFFRFFTTPPIQIYIPDTEEMDYHHSIYLKVLKIILKGGYDTSDLG